MRWFPKPRGTFTRGAPEFFNEDMYHGGVPVEVTLANNMTIGLYNSSASPVMLLVFGVTVECDAFASIQFGWNLGVLAHQAAAVVPSSPDAAAGSGVICYQDAPITPVAGGIRLPGDTFWQWPHDFPMATIMPSWTWALQITTATMPTTAAAHFWWLEASQGYNP